MPMIVYLNGQFVPKEDATISPDDRGFLFADGAYEVLRSYGGRLFKAEEHFERMKRSLRELRIHLSSEDQLLDITKKLLLLNDLEGGEAGIYIQVTRGVAPRKHTFPEEGTPPTIYATASRLQPSEEKWIHGVKIILVPDIRWERCDIKSVALLPNVLASQRAKEAGAEEAVFVRNGVVTEGAHTNVCAVLDGQLVTHPATNHILAGISRKVVLDLCRELHIPCREAPVFEEQLREASELMITGTTTEIMPVVQVGEWPVGEGRPGPIVRELQQAFRKLAASLA
jgi:D-alanine transaminase